MVTYFVVFLLFCLYGFWLFWGLKRTLEGRKNNIRYLSIEQWKKLDSLKKSRRDSLIVKLLYFTGCTVNELINIKISDFDFRKGILRIRGEVSRNSRQRNVFVPHELLKLVKAYRKENDKSDFIFYTRQSCQMTTKRVRQLVQKYCRQAGITNANPQLLRYTHIAHAYMKNIPVDAIQQQVGLRKSRAIEIFSQLRLSAVPDAYRNFAN